jgi:hypothetical protein
MCSQAQFDPFRVLLTRNDATELLVECLPDGVRLPVLLIRRHARIAEELTIAAKKRWNLATYCLFIVPAENTSTSRPSAVLLETPSPSGKIPEGTEWRSFSSLIAKDFGEPTDAVAFGPALGRLAQYRSGELQGSFARMGWFQKVIEWVQAEAAAVGLRLTGAFRQLNASPTFSLIRFDTNGPALWFKAVGHPNVQEFRISRTLACLFPAFVPRTLAVREEWNAWLMTEIPGTHPDENTDIEVWAMVTRTLADLQIASIGNTVHLIEAGCRDVRTSTLVSRVDPFLDMVANLMERQTTQKPAPLTRSEIAALGMRLKDVLTAYSGLDILNTLGHLDFNQGNIIASGDYCVLLDWAEACVGPPFLTFQYLLERLRRLQPARQSWETRLLSEYSAKWQALMEPQEVAATLAAAPLLAVFTYAAAAPTWRNTDLLKDPDIARHFRSLARRIKLEADRWSARESRSVVSTV